MLKTILKIASGYQLVAFVLLLLAELNLVALIIANDLPLQWSQRVTTLLNMVMNLSLAKFYWDSAIILSPSGKTKIDQKKFRVFGLSSIALCGLNQLGAIVERRNRPPIPDMKSMDLDLWIRIQVMFYSWMPFMNKVVYFISSTPNLFLIFLLYLIISRDLNDPNKIRKGELV